MGPVSVPFRADEPMSPRQRPHRSGGSERRSSLHRGEEEEKTKTLFIYGLILSGFVFSAVWIRHGRSKLRPAVPSPDHRCHPSEVSSRRDASFFFSYTSESRFVSRSFQQSDRRSRSRGEIHRRPLQTRTDQTPLHHGSSGGFLGRFVPLRAVLWVGTNGIHL